MQALKAICFSAFFVFVLSILLFFSFVKHGYQHLNSSAGSHGNMKHEA